MKIDCLIHVSYTFLQDHGLTFGDAVVTLDAVPETADHVQEMRDFLIKNHRTDEVVIIAWNVLKTS